MNINIREHIKKNFKDAKGDEFKVAIESSISDQDDITLPGLGVFFEILWSSCNETEQTFILNKLNENI